jgi:hypothetical protein
MVNFIAQNTEDFTPAVKAVVQFVKEETGECQWITPAVSGPGGCVYEGVEPDCFMVYVAGRKVNILLSEDPDRAIKQVRGIQ